MSKIDTSLDRYFHNVTATAAIFAFGLGSIVFVFGWLLGITRLHTPGMELGTVQPLTALSLVCMGASLWWLRNGVSTRGTHIASIVCASGVIVIAIISLLVYWFGGYFNIDVMFSYSDDRLVHLAPGGIASPNAALSLLLCGFALLLLDRSVKGDRYPAEWLALAGGAIAFTGLVGYSYGVRSLYQIAAYGMALPVSIALFSCAIGILCARTNRGWMGLLASPGAGGVVARHLLPAVLVMPPVLGFVYSFGNQIGLYSEQFGLALFVTAHVILFAILVGWSAKVLERLDAQRNEAMMALQQLSETLETRVAERTAELQRSEVRFRAVAETANDALVMSDSSGKIVYFNHAAAHIFGHGEKEIVGQTLATLMPGRYRAAHEAGLQRFLTTGKANVIGRTVELVGLKKDGAEFPLELSLSSWSDNDQTYFSGFIRDITERREAEEYIKRLNEDLQKHAVELGAANKELEAFSYSVSHDLRAPLRAIDGFSQALLEDYRERFDERGRDYLNRVRVAAQRMAQLIDDLLKLARVTRAELNVAEVDLSDLAGEVITELRRQEPHRYVDVVIEPNLQVAGDPRLLRVAMDNLIGNAWKFTGRTQVAHIEFSTEVRDNIKTYLIRDNGVGFDMNYVDKLFGTFQRLHDMREFPGTGIGLATVQRVIKRHGGTVWAESVIGKGATFYFTLGRSDAGP